MIIAMSTHLPHLDNCMFSFTFPRDEKDQWNNWEYELLTKIGFGIELSLFQMVFGFLPKSRTGKEKPPCLKSMDWCNHHKELNAIGIVLCMAKTNVA